MAENQSGSAAEWSGGMGIGDTILHEKVEPSSLAAASDRLPVHLNSSNSTACPGDTQDCHQSSSVLVEELQRRSPENT